MIPAQAVEKSSGRVEEQGLLFEYTVKLLLLAGFLELVLYRLVSRLGMHLSKVGEKYEWVRVTFQALSSIGFALLNTVALLIFLALLILLFKKFGLNQPGAYSSLLMASVSLLLLLTVAYLLFPPAMLGSVAYNLLAFSVILMLVVQYMRTHRFPAQRAFMLCFFLGISGWLYYQIVSTAYGMFGQHVAPPMVHEVNRAGEALMVLASILVLWAYGGAGLFTKNKRQRRRVLTFVAVGGTVFFALLFLDYFLGLYDEALAQSVRKAGEGISWIFQMGMGYTFYLPFALYVTGLLCWSYTVLKLTTTGQMAGYGVGLIFLAGYALQLSHLTLMVVLGLMLLNLDVRRKAAVVREESEGRPLVRTSMPLFDQKS